MVKLLLSHYASPHARTASNLTPRDLAGDPEIAKMLLDAEETFLGTDLIPFLRHSCHALQFKTGCYVQIWTTRELHRNRNDFLLVCWISATEMKKLQECARELCKNIDTRCCGTRRQTVRERKL